jgi:hypothetical protein
MKAAQSQLCAQKTTKVTGFSRMLKDEVGLTYYAYAALRRCRIFKDADSTLPRFTRASAFFGPEGFCMR